MYKRGFLVYDSEKEAKNLDAWRELKRRNNDLYAIGYLMRLACDRAHCHMYPLEDLCSRCSHVIHVLQGLYKLLTFTKRVVVDIDQERHTLTA